MKGIRLSSIFEYGILKATMLNSSVCKPFAPICSLYRQYVVAWGGRTRTKMGGYVLVLAA